MKSIFIIACITFTVAGQLLVKKGAITLKESGSILDSLTNIYIILGLLMAVVAACAWIKALQYYKLSYAYPFMSLSFPIVAIFSELLFNEIVKFNQWIGLAIVLIGLIVGSR